MEDKRLLFLYQRFIEDIASAEELVEFDEYLADPRAKNKLFEMLDLKYAAQEPAYRDISAQRKLKVLQQLTDRFAAPVIKAQSVRLWPRVAYAAAAVAAITLGIWFFSAHYINGRHPEFNSGPLLANDIGPGSNRATLTLANGKTIVLNGAKKGVVIGDELKYNDGSFVGNALRPGVMLTASTPRGGTYQITLPDGSKVWLNAASAIKFPVSFKGLVNRVVSVSGEAYFQVAKDKKHPFIVKSAGQDIQVLGTHFNINAYHDEDAVKTTLLEGSVKITMLKGGISKVLQIGQQSSVADDQIKVEKVDADDIVAWKNGKFVFDGETIQSIMRKIARWYDVEIVYQEIPVKNNFSGSMGRFETIGQVLRKIEMTNEVHFRIEGRRVVVLK